METIMQDLVTRATRLAARLKERGETIAVAESSTGGMISAALLAVPGASAYFIGGAVVYTRASRRVLLGISDDAMAGMRRNLDRLETQCLDRLQTAIERRRLDRDQIPWAGECLQAQVEGLECARSDNNFVGGHRRP